MSLKDDIKAAVQYQVRQKIASMQPKKKSVGGFISNVASGTSDLAKGLLYAGKEAFTNPINTISNIAQTGLEIAKQGIKGYSKLSTPGYTAVTLNPIDAVKQIKQSYKGLRDLTYEEQKQMFNDALGKIASESKTKGERNLGLIGLSTMQSITHMATHPIEYAYDKPVTFGLDILAMGGGKATKEVFKYLGRTQLGQAAKAKATELFVPRGKLVNAGYQGLADDMAKTQTNIINAQQNIIKNTAKRFEHDFGLNTQERFEMFETIDRLRRAQPRVEQILNPKLVSNKLDDIAKKIDYQLTGNFNAATPQSQALRQLNLASVKSPGDFFSIIAKKLDDLGIKNNKTINALTETTDDMFNLLEGESKSAFINATIVPKASSANPKIQRAIDWWLNEQVPKLQKATGLSKDQAITNYLHHFFPEKLKVAEGNLSAPLRYSSKGYLKKSRDVTGFSKDPIVSIAAIKSKIAVSAMKDSFIQRTITKYSKNIDDLRVDLMSKIGAEKVDELEKSGRLIDYMKKVYDLEEFKPQGSLRFFKNDGGVGVSRKVEMHLMPKVVVESLNNFVSPKNTALDTLLKPLEVFNRNWKPLATAARPRYHTRNVLGNLSNSSIVAGNEPVSYVLRRQLPTATMQIKGYLSELQKSNTTAGIIARKLFPKITMPKYIKMAVEDDIIGRGFFAADLHDIAKVAENADDIIKVINSIKSPAEVYRIPGLGHWLRASQNIGQALEDNARLSLYIQGLKKGMTRIQAKQYVNKHLFDYLTGLGEADKIIKKIIPFWSWQRFNVPLQTGSLISTPGRYTLINKTVVPVLEQQEKQDELRQYFTQEEKEAGFLKVDESTTPSGEKLSIYGRTRGVLPISDLNSIADLLRLDFDGVGINPLVSLAQKISRNENFFGQPIERFPGEQKKFLGVPMRGVTAEVLQIIPVLNEINKFFAGSYSKENAPDKGLRLNQVINPIGLTVKNVEETKYFSMLEKEKELTGSWESGLISLYKKYFAKSAKSKEEKVFANNVIRLEQYLKSKGVSDIELLKAKVDGIKRAIKEKVNEKIQKKIRQQKQ